MFSSLHYLTVYVKITGDVRRVLDPEIAQVLDCEAAQKEAGKSSRFIDEFETEFYECTPFQYLSKYVQEGNGSFNLELARQKPYFKWVCVAANLYVRDTNKANADSARVRVPSRWNFDELNKQLEDYPNRGVIELLKYGFPLECDASRGDNTEYKNHKGAQINEKEVQQYIDRELENGTLIGPFETNPFGEAARFSPMNTRDKKDSHEKRIIMDLSWPKDGRSVNTGINKSWYRGKKVKCQLPSVESLAAIVRAKGRKCRVFKRDMKRAYKQIPVCIGDVHLLGYTFQNLYYFDITLPMGLVNSCLICQMVSDMIIYVFQKEGYSGLNYLDDLGGAEIPVLAEQAFEVLGQIMQEMGVAESCDKAVPPSCMAVFLGILFNTLHMRLEITPERMQEIKTELQQWSCKQEASLRQLQSLIGKLSFCASTMRAARLFYARILNFIREIDASKPFQMHELPQTVYKDIAWWLKMIEQLNGISVIPDAKWQAPNRVIATDACLTGIGGYSQGEYFHAKYPHFVVAQRLSINELECVAIMIAMKVWGSKIAGTNTLFQCDNKNTVACINRGKARNSYMQALLREIAYLCAINDCNIRVVFIPGNTNRLPDMLSRIPLGVVYKIQFAKETRGIKTTRTVISSKHFMFSNNW